MQATEKMVNDICRMKGVQYEIRVYPQTGGLSGEVLDMEFEPVARIYDSKNMKQFYNKLFKLVESL
jgi:hypothetical protein